MHPSSGRSVSYKLPLAILAVVVVTVAAALAAAASNAGAAPAASHAKLKVAFIPQLIGIPYFTAMQKGGDQAATDLGVTFTYTGPTTASAPGQVQIFNSLIQQHYNAISISVLDPASLNPVIKKARDAGIAVLTSDSDSPTSVRQGYVAQALDKDLGFTLIDHLVDQIKKSGQIAIVSGVATATNLNTWIRYMKVRLKNYPNVKLVDVRYSSTTSDAQNQAQELLTRYPNLKGIVAVASTTVPGVSQAVQAAGKTGKVAVIGYGSPATVRPFVHAGVMKESILWDPQKLGYLTVWAMVQAAENKPFKAVNNVPHVGKVRWFSKTKILLLGKPLVITKANVDKYNF